MFIDYCQQLVGYYSIKLYGSVIYGFVITAVNYHTNYEVWSS